MYHKNMKKKEYQSPTTRWIKIDANSLMFASEGIIATKGDYESDSWNKDDGLTGGHDDYQSAAWGESYNGGVETRRDQYRSSTWGD